LRDQIIGFQFRVEMSWNKHHFVGIQTIFFFLGGGVHGCSQKTPSNFVKHIHVWSIYLHLA